MEPVSMHDVIKTMYADVTHTESLAFLYVFQQDI